MCLLVCVLVFLCLYWLGCVSGIYERSHHVVLYVVILRSVCVCVCLSTREKGRDGDKDHRCVCVCALVLVLAFTVCHL